MDIVEFYQKYSTDILILPVASLLLTVIIRIHRPRRHLFCWRVELVWQIFFIFILNALQKIFLLSLLIIRSVLLIMKNLHRLYLNFYIAWKKKCGLLGNLLAAFWHRLLPFIMQKWNIWSLKIWALLLTSIWWTWSKGRKTSKDFCLYCHDIYIWHFRLDITK